MSDAQARRAITVMRCDSCKNKIETGREVTLYWVSDNTATPGMNGNEFVRLALGYFCSLECLTSYREARAQLLNNAWHVPQIKRVDPDDTSP